VKFKKVWCICLLAWSVWLLSAACAETTYDALCEKAKLDPANVAAWIEIDGASISQPVMQHPNDDAYYSSHDPHGNEIEGGALYTQASYNNKEFSDPVTIIYGSSTKEGMVLRNLQEIYSGKFDACREIKLHLPDETLEYEVFAAVPYAATHILHYNDFNMERRFTGFFDSVFGQRVLGMHLMKEDRPEFGDRVIILSTGLRGDKLQRYLVMAKLVTNKI